MRLFKVRYKYTLESNEVYELGITFPNDIKLRFLTLSRSGRLEVFMGFGYDGPSGPTIDTKLFIWTSLPHDIIYLLIRLGLLPPEYRKIGDRLLRKMNLEGREENYLGNGLLRLKPMSRFRAWYVYELLRLGGGPAADPKNKKKVWEF